MATERFQKQKLFLYQQFVIIFLLFNHPEIVLSVVAFIFFFSIRNVLNLVHNFVL